MIPSKEIFWGKNLSWIQFFISLFLWVFLEDTIFNFFLVAQCFQFCAWFEILVVFLLYRNTVFQIRRVQIRIKMLPTVTAVYDTLAMLPKTAMNTLWRSFWVWLHIRVQFGKTSVVSCMLLIVNSSRWPLHYTGTKDKWNYTKSWYFAAEMAIAINNFV
jgi:hypothetical protein